jgi:thermitase
MPLTTAPFRRFALCAFVAALISAGVAAPCVAKPAARGYVRILVAVRPDTRQPGAVRRFKTKATLSALHVRVLRVPRRNERAVLARLRRSASVRYAESNRVVLRLAAANYVQSRPSDPLWPEQWGADLADAPTAWSVTRGDSKIVVAVVDTGVDFAQPDLQGAFVPGYDFVNGDSDPSDDQGHGTAVAGIVAARDDNGAGGSGLCPRCSVMPVKVVSAAGTATELDVAAGITWAADHGARVINLSLGGTYGAAVRDAVNYATDKGAVVVAAAGNNGSSSPFYPAADPGVLSVGATQPDDTLYPWSDYGNWVSVAAPGCDLAPARGGGYGEICGTSASSPFVAALAGLAISYAPTATPATIIQAITSTARPVSGIANGRVDFAGALAALGAAFPLAPVVTPAPAAPAAVVLAPVRPPRTSSKKPTPRFRLGAVRLLGLVAVEPTARQR